MIKKIITIAFLLLGFLFKAHSQITITISPQSTTHWEGGISRFAILPVTRLPLSTFTFSAQVVNGTIIQQNLNPSLGPMGVFVKWDCGVTTGSITIHESAFNITEISSLTIRTASNTPFYCTTISPTTQGLRPGFVPDILLVNNCSDFCPSIYTTTYQWQVADVTADPNSTPVFIDIPFANTIDFQPPSSIVRSFKLYRRKTMQVSSGIPPVIISNAASVNFYDQLSAGTIIGTGLVYFDDQPIISQIDATGGVCNPVNYLYQWERSVNGGVWELVCTTKEYTSTLPVTQPTTFRRRVTCETESVLSNELSFTISTTPLDPGWITRSGSSALAYGAIPGVTQTEASGGVCLAHHFQYIWERSVNGNPWHPIGEGVNYPTGVGIIGNSLFRRKVICGNEISYTPPVAFTLLPYTSPNVENLNYVRINTILQPDVFSFEQADNLSAGEKLQATVYTDGLGRPIQKVVKQGSLIQSPENLDPTIKSNYQDLVNVIEYDELGRENKTFLPYATQTNAGFFKSNAHTEQNAFTNAKYKEFVGSEFSYSQTTFDGSPFNKITNVKLPGYAWNTNPEYKGLSKDYDLYTTSDVVRVWDIGFNPGDVPTSTLIYQNFQLVKDITKDEKNKLIVEYKDFSGKVILKKVQEKEGIDIDMNGHRGWLCTYYVYDDFDNLRYVITPKAVSKMDNDNNWVIDTDTKKGLCFYQEYDKKGRVIVKHSPDLGEIWMVYDNRNRLVFSQDENQRQRSGLVPAKAVQWSFSLFDDNDRKIAAGFIDDSRNRATIQTMVDNLSLTAQNKNVTIYTPSSEVITAYNPVAGKVSGVEICSPCLNTTINLIQYYDNYNSSSKPFNNISANDFAPTTVQYLETATKASFRTQGFVTTSKVRVLDEFYDDSNPVNDKFLSTTTYIDEKGRLIQTHIENIKGGTDVASIQHDFSGKLSSTNVKHYAVGSGFSGLNIITRNDYDLLGRTTHLYKLYTFSSSDISNLSKYKKLSGVSFDEFGRIKTKNVGADPKNVSNPIETIDYSYNIQGWLTGINKDYALADGTSFGEYNNQWNRHFGLYLGYENTDNNLSTAVPKQWGGNIMGTIWRSQGDNAPRKYEYQYDNINRFTAANFTQKDKPSSSDPWASTKVDISAIVSGYDPNGNITGMKQTGIIPGTEGGVLIDDLVYQYYDKSNKLKSVTDLAFGGSPTQNGKQGDFKDYVPSNNIDYDYDWNGNLKYDKNRSIIDNSSNLTDASPNSGILYNYLNLPEKITIKGKSVTEYIYDAAGNKLGKKVSSLVGPPATKTSFYIGSLLYEDDQLQSISNEEGRLRIIEPVAAWAPPSNAVNYLEIAGNIDLTNGGVQQKWGVWDYFILDNLGNTRMVLTEEAHTQQMRCGMEDASTTLATEEEQTFGQSGNGNEVKITRVFTSTTGWDNNASEKVSKLINQLSGGYSTAVGPNNFLKIMAGDQLTAASDYFYKNTGATSSNGNILSTIVGGFLGAINSGISAAGIIKDNYVAISSANNGPTSPLNHFLTNQPAPSQSSTPRAYLNMLFFDEQFRYVPESSGAIMIDETASSTNKEGTLLLNKTANKNGYVYIYLSNESSNIPVYFDDFKVMHQRGVIIEDNVYYPFGLKVAGLSAKAALKPNVLYGYQGTYAEIDEETGFNEFAMRTYDPQIGRWIQGDPIDVEASMYIGMSNDPINFTDPEGASTGPIDFGKLFEYAKSILNQRLLTPGLPSGEGDAWFGVPIEAMIPLRNVTVHSIIRIPRVIDWETKIPARFMGGMYKNIIGAIASYGRMMQNTPDGMVARMEFIYGIVESFKSAVRISPRNPAEGYLIMYVNGMANQVKNAKSLGDLAELAGSLTADVGLMVVPIGGEASILKTTTKFATFEKSAVTLTKGSVDFVKVEGVIAKGVTKELPTQIHHFATNKHSFFTKQMAEIADEFGLNLDGAWNKQALPHLGRHPNEYHKFVLQGMQNAQLGAKGSQAEFLNLFNQYVKQPVIQNPGLLRKSGW